MKIRLISFILFLIIFFNYCEAQNCKYKINGVDEFTNKFTKQTEPSKVLTTFYTAGFFSFKEEDSTYYCIFDYRISNLGDLYSININKSAQLMFLLENGDIITLYSAKEIKGIKQKEGGVMTCFLSNVNYPISKKQIEMFSNSKVKTIRMYRSEGSEKESFIDYEIKDKFQEIIQEQVKCIL